MSFKVIPAFFCLLAMSLIVLFVFMQKKDKEKIELLFSLSLFGMLSIEFVSYVLGNTSPEKGFVIVLLKIYYSFAVAAAYLHLLLSLKITSLLNNVSKSIIVLSFLICLSIVIVPNIGIIGVEKTDLSYTRIEGPLYWVIQLGLAVPFLVSCSVLLQSAILSKDRLIKRQSMILFLGSVTLALAVIFIVILMQLGFSINATLVISISVCVLMSVLMLSGYEHRRFKLLALVPFLNEYKLSGEAVNAILKYYDGDLQAAVNAYETAVIQDTLEKCEGNKSLAAAQLGISRTTLRRKLEGSDNDD